MNRTDQVESILRGAYDLRVHAVPDSKVQRRFDALDTARYAHEYQLAGFTLVSGEYSTAPMAQALSRIYPGLKVAGAVVLDRAAGGVSVAAARTAIDLGAKLVSMPYDAAAHSIAVRGRLSLEAQAVLEVVKDSGVALSTGGADFEDSLAVARAAGQLEMGRLIYPAVYPVNIEKAKAIADHGAVVEFAFAPCMPSSSAATCDDIAEAVNAVGAARCIVSSGLGGWQDPSPAEGLRMAISALLEAGLSEEQVSVLVKANPLRLAGIA
ncbi:MAG: hypothetical protein FJ319_14150 [SAR202 cluster bacterium]|nr:hypothetical protein [SAR202 cluster bacterium]